MREYVFSNTEMTNLFASEDGTIQRTEPFANAVITQLIPAGIDEETGEQKYARVTSLMVNDPDMKGPLMRLAGDLMNLG
jgi:hypothetical protein